MLSIWERNNFIQYDYIIIGSGIVGLTTAYYLKEKFPTTSVLILERGLLPSGASTKNAGFACMGSLTELLDDLKTSSEHEVVNLFLLRKKGLERLQHLLGKDSIGYKANGSYELLFEQDIQALDKIDYLNQLLQKEINQSAFEIVNDKLNEFGFDQQVKALIKNTCEGEIDTGLMMKNLIQKVTSLGIEIKTGCEVISFEDKNHEVEVHCKNPFSSEDLIFKSNKLIICNNAFAKTLLPSLDIAPGRGQVLITKPIPNLPFKGIFHFHQGYFYFREYKGCVLFGGGRNLDFERETTTDFALNESIQTDLVQKLQELILPNHPFEIDMQWSGIMAFGADKNPIITQFSENILIGVRMGGMGIAIGSEVGFRLSEMILH